MQKLRTFFATLLALCCSVVAVAADHSFADGRAQATLPDSFLVSEQANGSLIATFGSDGNHALEISVTDVPSSAAGQNAAVEFVKSQAKKFRVSAKESAKRVVFMHPAGDFERDGTTYRVVHWQVGVGRAVFVITLTAPVPMSNELNSFLGAPLNDLVNDISLKSGT